MTAPAYLQHLRDATIESESVSHLTQTDATLEAQINTEGMETTYEFHLLTAPLCFEANPPCERPQYLFPLPSGKLLGSFVGQGVSVELNSAGVSVSPGERYEYWVTATSTAGTAEGHHQTFTAQEAAVQPPNTTTSPRQSNAGTQSTGQASTTQAVTATTTDQVMPTPKNTPEPKVLTNAQKLANALKVCEKKPKRQRASCKKQAHRKYGTTGTRAKKR